MYQLVYFYRHPNPIYFSIEKLFGQIGEWISKKQGSSFQVDKRDMPFASKLKTVLKNIGYTKKQQGHINHITGDVHYAMLGCSKKHINLLTIHDCVPLQDGSGSRARYWFIKKLWYDWPVQKADMVTVISDNTKKELIRYTHCPPEKIRVIGNFVDPGFQFAPFVFNESCPRILFIGSTPNKNLNRLIESLQGLNVVLDIVGLLSGEQIKRLKKANIRYEQSSGLSQEALVAKYQQCDILAFPSTYEGFGLPIVEAQATGRPLLSSNLSPMREVAGEGACLIDPYDPDSIRSGLIKIINDPVYRESIIKNGLENAKKFTLDSVAQQYVELYQELLQTKPQQN
ncbi:MAG: glycosyltransferase family 4 protein [Bacteroidetes bacterium]|nr:glycosyltransferase family 4 protein [Bacteroidota bacterium]